MKYILVLVTNLVKYLNYKLGGKVSSINMSNMKSMCILMTVYIDMLRVILVLKLVEVLAEVKTVMLILKLEEVIRKDLNYKLEIKLVL